MLSVTALRPLTASALRTSRLYCFAARSCSPTFVQPVAPRTPPQCRISPCLRQPGHWHCLPNPRAPQYTRTASAMAVAQVLPHREDLYGGVIVDSELPEDGDAFAQQLTASVEVRATRAANCEFVAFVRLTWSVSHSLGSSSADCTATYTPRLQPGCTGTEACRSREVVALARCVLCVGDALRTAHRGMRDAA